MNAGSKAQVPGNLRHYPTRRAQLHALKCRGYGLLNQSGGGVSGWRGPFTQ
jgi:hypothetical protein